MGYRHVVASGAAALLGIGSLVVLSQPLSAGELPERHRDAVARATREASFPRDNGVRPAAPTNSADAVDPPNDVPDGRGDLVRVAIDYAVGSVTVRATTREGADPASNPNWRDGETALIWAFETNGDTSADTAAVMFSGNNGVDAVVIDAGSGEVRCAGTPRFTAPAAYQVQFPDSCIGRPAVIRMLVQHDFDTDPADPNAGVQRDIAPNSGVVGPVGRPPSDQPGYWLVGGDGGVFAFRAPYHGSTGGHRLSRPVVSMAPTPTGKGYWLVAADGGIFAFGDAGFFGSTGHIRLNQPVVGMAATPTGRGYWLVASDGGIFAFGDARFFGSTGGIRLQQPIEGMAAASDDGYWLAARDGGIFAFGGARFLGSTGGRRNVAPVVAMVATPGEQGYWLATERGDVFPFGDAEDHGSLTGTRLSAPIVGMAGMPAQQPSPLPPTTTTSTSSTTTSTSSTTSTSTTSTSTTSSSTSTTVPSTATVSGVVEDSESKMRIPFATVTVVHAGQDPVNGPSATTKLDGSYTLEGVPAMNVTIEADAATHKPQQRTATFTNGEVRSGFDFELERIVR